MTEKLPQIYFYLPDCDKLEGKMPESADIYLPGLYQDGVYCWTLQTYLRFKADGFPCELTGIMPAEGIVLAHRSSLPINLRPGPKVLMICLLADKERHPYAQLHVVLNPHEEMLGQLTFWESYYIPHWPQPGLIKRDRDRADRFENIAYFGHERNLAPELKDPSWHEQLNHLGLRFKIVDRDRWHDFSEVDAILAVRSFDNQDFTAKPATKLYNAWQAGVPAILGRETSFQAERKSELDYLEVGSLDSAIAALLRLRDDKTLRRAMSENGRVRAEETQVARIVERWRQLITEKAVPAYDRWRAASTWTQQTFFIRRYLSFKMYRLKNRVRSLREQK